MFGNDGLDSIIHYKPPSAIEHFLQSPQIFLASEFYRAARCKKAPGNLHSLPKSDPTKIGIVCMADTHNMLDKAVVPDSDILIHAGDLTQSGTSAELQKALDLIMELPHPHKIVIPGNHNKCLAEASVLDALALPENLTILRGDASEVTVHSTTLKVYGSPWTPKHGSGVFQYRRSDAALHWSHILSDTDILITHGPPMFHLDMCGLGCPALLDALWAVHPRLHVFGHIHGGQGMDVARWDHSQQLYESLMQKKLGICALFKLLLATCQDLLATMFGLDNVDGSMLLVNAAICGGSRDKDICDVVVIDLPKRSG
jgi:predicted phosphohydrolase